MLQFFEAPVVKPDLTNVGNNPIHMTHYGRLKASKHFHRYPEAKKDRKLWEQLHTINSTYKGYLCQHLMIEKLRHDLDAAILKRNDLERQMDNMISQAGCTYTTIEAPGLKAIDVINGNTQNVTQDVRNLINMNCRV